MSMNNIKIGIVNAIPHARRYGRALTGDANFSDSVLTIASSNVIERAPTSSVLLPEKMILPLLLMEFHKLLDSDSENIPSNPIVHAEPSATPQDEPLYEKIDRALHKLTESQRRVFLLTTLEQLRPSVIARMLSLPDTDVKQQFKQAHIIVNEYINANKFEQAA